MKHETHIPTEQTETETQIRVPRPDENGRRAKSDSPPPKSRTKSSLRLRASDKLKKRAEFLAVSKKGNRLVGKFLCLDLRRGSRLRLGITASTHYGNSPERNRFKRLVREAFRTGRHRLPVNLDLNVLPRQKAKEAKMGDIQDELFRLLSC